MRFIILTAAYGEGHNAAARGLHAAFLELGAGSEIVDVFAMNGGAFYDRSRRDYLALINRAPKIWAFVFGLIHRFPIGEFSLPALGKMQAALAALLAEKKPDAVISVYPVYGYLIEKLFPRRADRSFSFHTVVTDSITINSVWYRCASDTFLVPNEDTARVMRAAGFANEEVMRHDEFRHALGPAVDFDFASGVAGDLFDARTERFIATHGHGEADAIEPDQTLDRGWRLVFSRIDHEKNPAR